MGMVPYAACECGAEKQTVYHVNVLHYHVHCPPHGVHGLMVPDDEKIDRLLKTRHEILKGLSMDSHDCSYIEKEISVEPITSIWVK